MGNVIQLWPMDDCDILIDAILGALDYSYVFVCPVHGWEKDSFCPLAFLKKNEQYWIFWNTHLIEPLERKRPHLIRLIKSRQNARK